MQSHGSHSALGTALRAAASHARAAGVVAARVAGTWAVVFLLTVFAWLPAMHARTHQLQHASGVACTHSHDQCTTASASPAKSTPASPASCDICSQLLLALLCGAVPALDPPLPAAQLTHRVEVTRQSVSARELAHLPPSRGPPARV